MLSFLLKSGEEDPEISPRWQHRYNTDGLPHQGNVDGQIQSSLMKS